MPIVVNSNTTATTASFNLSRANDALRKSLARLSSGNRIVSPADDAGGMAVAYKLNSKLKRTEAVRQNIQNGISYLQVQDGALSVVGKILDRISELRTMSMDVTKNSGDIENYSKEFVELQVNSTKSGTKSSTVLVCLPLTIRIKTVFVRKANWLKFQMKAAGSGTRTPVIDLS